MADEEPHNAAPETFQPTEPTHTAPSLVEEVLAEAKSLVTPHRLDEQGWYKGDGGAYFQERRPPFFRLNLVCYFISAVFFVYFTYSITADYIDQQQNPPTTTNLVTDVTQLLPAILLCNRDPNVPLTVAYASFDTEQGSVDLTDKMQVVEWSNGRVC